MATRDPGSGREGSGRDGVRVGWPVGLAGLAGSTCRRCDRAEEAEVAGARREKERKEMTGGVAVSVGGERDAALRNVADGWARLVRDSARAS